MLSTTVTSLQQKFASFESERREINELRSAHTSQNQLLQKLQDKVSFNAYSIATVDCSPLSLARLIFLVHDT